MDFQAIWIICYAEIEEIQRHGSESWSSSGGLWTVTAQFEPFLWQTVKWSFKNLTSNDLRRWKLANCNSDLEWNSKNELLEYKKIWTKTTGTRSSFGSVSDQSSILWGRLVRLISDFLKSWSVLQQYDKVYCILMSHSSPGW